MGSVTSVLSSTGEVLERRSYWLVSGVVGKGPTP